MQNDFTRSEREALKAIYRFTRDGSEAHTGTLAERLGLSPGTVTTLVKRLADRGLVDHRPYQGVRFTAEGRRAAVAAIRVHRIVERFLADMLGYAWNEADALAVAFEHDLPDEVIDRLYVALHRPETCPHGFHIPRAEADEMPNTPELYDLEPGDVAEVAVSGSTDAEILSFLGTLGVVPGVQVAVIEKHPFDGPLVVEVDGQTRTIGERVARQVYVTRRIAPEAERMLGRGPSGPAPKAPRAENTEDEGRRGNGARAADARPADAREAGAWSEDALPADAGPADAPRAAGARPADS